MGNTSIYLRRFLLRHGEEVYESPSVAAVEPVGLLLPGHRDLGHVLGQLDLHQPGVHTGSTLARYKTSKLLVGGFPADF